MGDDDEEETPKIEEMPKNKEKNNKLKKSSVLGMSLNNNLFGFNNAISFLPILVL